MVEVAAEEVDVVVVTEVVELAHPVREPIGVFCGDMVVDVDIGDAEPRGLYVANGWGKVRMSGPRVALSRMSGLGRCVWRALGRMSGRRRCVGRGAEQRGGADEDCARVGFAVGGANVRRERELGGGVVWVLEGSVGECYAEAAGVGGVGSRGVVGLPWSVGCGVDKVGVAEDVVVGGGFLAGDDGPRT